MNQLIILALIFLPHSAPAAEQKNLEPLSLLERKGDEIVDAPARDLALARTYRAFKNKGEIVNGMRMTIMTRKNRYKVGEPVRVIHVLESVKKGIEMDMMGPAPVCHDYVDEKIIENEQCYGSHSASGTFKEVPVANFNFDISTYRFKEPGTHTIRWKSKRAPYMPPESNLIQLNIEPK